MKNVCLLFQFVYKIQFKRISSAVYSPVSNNINYTVQIRSLGHKEPVASINNITDYHITLTRTIKAISPDSVIKILFSD